MLCPAVLSLLRARPAAARAQVRREERPREAGHLPSEEVQEHPETKQQPGGGLQPGSLSVSDLVQHGVWLVFLAMAAGRNGNQRWDGTGELPPMPPAGAIP